MALDLIIFQIAVLIFSVVIHELMHGIAADRLGDPTARLAGRLTLNPIPHLDMFGSVILPGMLAFLNSPFLFGWAKPVPYNPYNLRPGRFSEAIVAIAGPASNLVIALIAGLLIRSGIASGETVGLLFVVVFINILLAILNMIPLPPLDGSKVLASILPRSLAAGYDRLRAYLESNMFFGFGLVVLLILFLGNSFGAVVSIAARAISGV